MSATHPNEPVAPAWPQIDPFRRTCGRIWLRVFRWRTEGQPPPLTSAVFIAAPHTSNWDLPFMLAVAWSLGLSPTWLGKHSLFGPVFGWFFRWLGGVPVDRANRGDRVAASAELLRRTPRLFLVVSPPGTRGKTDHWKSGFYQIARAAKVPVCCSFLDFSRRVGGIGPSFETTGNVARDMDRIRAFYEPIVPKYPEQKSEIRLALESEGGESPSP